ncbi:uncharacterized protein LOC143149414 [Ptiloglossa arizonensis]|uniref:uncharacterized protein LOC143149414 n=1 Tax=Ptiloglossa arizonensis TaxID=3350558 RepID=UPI003FA04378
MDPPPNGSPIQEFVARSLRKICRKTAYARKPPEASVADVSPAPRRKVSRQPPHRRPWRGTTINKWFRNAICVRARMPECVSHRALQPCGNINRDRDREGGKLERVSHTPRVFLTPGTAGSWHSDELLHDNFTATLVYPMLRKPIPRAVVILSASVFRRKAWICVYKN